MFKCVDILSNSHSIGPQIGIGFVLLTTEGIPLELTDTTGRTKEAPNVKNEEPDAKVMNVDPTQMEKGDPTQIENALLKAAPIL